MWLIGSVLKHCKISKYYDQNCRYKFIRDEKSFNLENYINDFSQLPLSTVYNFDNPDDQVETLNKPITKCLSRHATRKRMKFTRSPAPWMKTLDIINLQKKRNELRTTTHRTQTELDWELFRNTRNELKYRIKSAKYYSSLAANNNYYSSLAANLTGFSSTSESNVPSKANENRDNIYSQTGNI